MRAHGILIALALAASIAPAHADNYLIVCTATCTASDGTSQPAGTALNRIIWDGKAQYAPPAGTTLIPDDGRAIYAPALPRPSTITALDFLARFTAGEQVAVQTAIGASPALGVGLTTGLAAGSIDLGSPVVKTWMDGLVTAGALTQARETAILTP